MRIKSILLLIILFVSSYATFGQTDTTKWSLKVNRCKLSAGYFYQGEHFGEAGLKIDYIQDKTKKKQNLSIIFGGQITKHDKAWYINPFVTLRYFKPFSYKVSLVTSLSYNYRQVQHIVSSSVTPEIGINLSHNWTITYGYNFFLDNKYSWTLPHRLALRLTLH
jgi:hypothetical protein